MDKLHNEELNDLNSPTNTVLLIKTRQMRWAGHVPGVREKNSLQGLGGEKDHIEDTGVEGRIMLR